MMSIMFQYLKPLLLACLLRRILYCTVFCDGFIYKLRFIIIYYIYKYHYIMCCVSCTVLVSLHCFCIYIMYFSSLF